MASPPFDINITTPEDNGIVSQHPAQARTFRDIVESWIKVNHNVQGRHDEVELDHQADASYPGTASVTTVWASNTSNANGALKMREGTGSIVFVGLTPGMCIPHAVDEEPAGFLKANGQAVSRSTFARLFNKIGTTWGAGDGSTTFNVPNLTGRTVFGVDASNTVLSAATWGGAGAVFGSSGGVKDRTLVQGNLPNVNLTADAAGSHQHLVIRSNSGVTVALTSSNFVRILGADYSLQGQNPSSNEPDLGLSSTAGSHGHNVPLGGSGTAFGVVPPGVAMWWLIKT